MLKATGSLLQGDALIIKSSIANASTKTPEEPPHIVIEPTKPKPSVQSDAGGDHCREILIPQTKIRIKVRERPLEKDMKNASNNGGLNLKSEARSVKPERDDLDDKTPTNEISISSYDMTDASVLKESMESEKQVIFF